LTYYRDRATKENVPFIFRQGAPIDGFLDLRLAVRLQGWPSERFDCGWKNAAFPMEKRHSRQAAGLREQ
jgi:hypothetical protein